MKTKELIAKISSGSCDGVFTRLYDAAELDAQKARYIATLEKFDADFGADRDIAVFSVPGRTEISGNHTDHNHGAVIAGSIDLDIVAVAAKRDDGIVSIHSEGFSTDVIDLQAYTQPDPAQFGTSASIAAGMCALMAEKGFAVGGFDAYTVSNVFKGSGLSSSAAFEDMIGNIENHFYNGGRVDNVQIAKIAQKAENLFFGKPCGLMDQTACAVGGIISIDFAAPAKPQIEKMPVDLSAMGYRLCIVNTGGNHADLTDDYASVPAEMKSVAAYFGKEVLRDTDENAVITAIPALRKSLGDRAILRALHFFAENRRVAEQKAALKAGDVAGFFRGVKSSGLSSFCYLQNVYTTRNLTEQGLSLALCLADRALADKDTAWRVHGGGFAGTIQIFLPACEVEGLIAKMNAVFGEGACRALMIRDEGAIRVF